MRRKPGRWALYAKIAVLDIATGLMLFSVFQTIPLPKTYITNRSLSSVNEQKPIKIGTPNRLVINSIGLDLPVRKGTYDPNNGSWTIGEDAAYYADNSVPSNNSNGVTLIYGHGKQPVFGSLDKLTESAEAIVYSDTKYVFHYKYNLVRWVSPNDTSIFTQSGQPQLLLQTCAGPYDSYRALYSFELTGVDTV